MVTGPAGGCGGVVGGVRGGWLELTQGVHDLLSKVWPSVLRSPSRSGSEVLCSLGGRTKKIRLERR